MERDEEVDALIAGLHDLRAGHGGALIVEGRAGMGTSALLDVVGPKARELGVRTAHVIAQAADRGADLAVARRWLDALGFDADARRAPRRVLLEILEHEPLVLVVDDAHHADAGSMALAAELSRRQAMVVAGLRATGNGVPSTDLAPLVRAATVMRPRPLGPRAVGVLLGRILGAPVSAEVAATATQATAGTPQLVVALAPELVGTAIDAAEVRSDEVRALADGIAARDVRERIDDPLAIEIAEIVALLDGWGTAARIATLLGRPAAAVRPLLDRLVATGLLRRADCPAFSRAFERTAILRSTSIVRSQRVLATGAVLLAADHEPLAAGRLLLDVDPAADVTRAPILRAAAEEASDLDDPGLAIELLERLLAEPVAADERTTVLVALGTTEVATGLERGTETLRAALNQAAAPQDVAAAAAALGWALAGGAQGEAAASVLAQARDRVRPLGDGLDVGLDVQTAEMSAWDAALRPARRAALARLRLAADASPLAVGAVLGAEGVDGVARGRPAREVATVCQRALGNGALADSPRGAATALSVSMMLGYAGHAQCGIDHVDHVITRLRANGLPALIRPATAFRGALKLMLGQVAAAEADLRSVVRAPWLVRSMPLMTAFLLECLIERDDLDGASALLAELDLEGGTLQELIPHAPFLHARGQLRMRRGDPHAALDDLRDCGRRLEAGGWTNPAVAPWRGSMAQVLVGLGRHDEARLLAAHEVRDAERFGAPVALSRALRAQAHTVAAPEAHKLLVRAVAVAGGPGAPLEHVAATGDLAAAEIAAGREAEARSLLHAALVLARELGAVAQARRIAGLLRQAGGRTRADGAGVRVLTPAQERVARLAASGSTNTEISAELVVSPKTVETHLRAAYRKLGIGSRTQLPHALRVREAAPADDATSLGAGGR